MTEPTFGTWPTGRFGGTGHGSARETEFTYCLTFAGVPLPTVAAVLGHAHPTTTALYTTAIGAEARELVARMWA